MSLTASTHFAIPSLIGRGMTEEAARNALLQARIYGVYPARCGLKTIPVTYAHGKFTIGETR